MIERWRCDRILPARITMRRCAACSSATSNAAGKNILLHSEQGFGDTIQFCRYVPLVAARGARVIVEVAAPLQDLMSDLAGATQVIPRGTPLPDFDYQCPLLSLPLAFGTR